ncbi:hypothetical protein ACFLZH_03975, partial [Patescibacteria group bacterium]
LFDIVYQQKTRDGIGYVPDHKDEMIKGYREGAKALGEFEAKKGQEGKAILTVEQARDAVGAIQMATVQEIAEQVEKRTRELTELSEKQAAELQGVQEALEKITGEKDQSAERAAQNAELLSQRIREWQHENAELESKIRDLNKDLDDLKKAHAHELKAEKEKGPKALGHVWAQIDNILSEEKSKKTAIGRKKSTKVLKEALDKVEEEQKKLSGENPEE